jgi:hypothetical protein
MIPGERQSAGQLPGELLELAKRRTKATEKRNPAHMENARPVSSSFGENIRINP